MKRIHSIDVTRGIVMIIMALDHVRDFMHVNSVTQNATNLATTNPALFFTRWITHICAPTFVFLAGVSAYLVLKKTNDVAATRKFLFTRGIWLIILEFTVVNLALWFDIKFRTLMFEVLGAIGLGRIMLSLLLKLPAKTIGILGILILFLHGLFPILPLNNFPLIKSILTPFFFPGANPLTPNLLFVTGYPPIPWMGIMFAGYATGKFFEKEESARSRVFFRIGLLAIVMFVFIRFINIYGDTVPWSVQKDHVFTFLSFMNISKYPPSLVFSLATLGITFLLLSITGKMKNKLTEIAAVYGSVPLFYFIIHLFLIHGIMVGIMLVQGFSFQDLVFNNLQLGRPAGKSGVSLAVIYLIWMAVVAMLYPLCKWYSHFKAKNRNYAWTRYL
jgi:uncharacterized membrane protein